MRLPHYRYIMLFYSFLNEQKCTHVNVFAGAECGYCPDCGEFIENKWYICRCSCCNIKRKSIIHFNKVIPESKYCTNCGAKEFYTEQLPSINFINIHFAVLKKEIHQPHIRFAKIQSWATNNQEALQRLLAVKNVECRMS